MILDGMIDQLKRTELTPIESIYIEDSMGGGSWYSVGQMLGSKEKRTGIVSLIVRTGSHSFELYATDRYSCSMNLLTEIQVGSVSSIQVYRFSSLGEWFVTAFEPFLEDGNIILLGPEVCMTIFELGPDEDSEDEYEPTYWFDISKFDSNTGTHIKSWWVGDFTPEKADSALLPMKVEV